MTFEELSEEHERLLVQLAGCSAAANGATDEPATRDMWGWSPAYQDVLDLRIKYDQLLESKMSPLQTAFAVVCGMFVCAIVGAGGALVIVLIRGGLCK